MRPRSICAWAALLATACGSSSGSGLFSGGHGNHPVIGAEAGTDPGSGGGKAAAGGGGTPAAGGQTHSTGSAAGAPPNTGGTPGTGGLSATGGKDGGAGKGGSGSGSGSAGAADTGGAAGTAAGGTAGDGAGGEMTGTGGSTGNATPHTVVCGTTPCKVGAALPSACCVSSVPLATVCIPTLGAGCANGGAAVTCDDATDCTPGEICCADSVGNLPITVCARDCKDGLDQLCRTNDECRKGGSCEPIDAQPDYSRCN